MCLTPAALARERARVINDRRADTSERTPVLPRTLLRLAMGVGSAESEAGRRIASEGRVLDPPVRYPRRRTKRQIELPWPSSARKAIAEPPAPVRGTFSHPSLRS